MKMISASGTAVLVAGGEAQAPGVQVAHDELGQLGLEEVHLAAVEALDERRVDVDADHVVAELGQAGGHDEADVAAADHRDPVGRRLPRAAGSSATSMRGLGSAGSVVIVRPIE